MDILHSRNMLTIYGVFDILCCEVDHITPVVAGAVTDEVKGYFILLPNLWQGFDEMSFRQLQLPFYQYFDIIHSPPALLYWSPRSYRPFQEI